MLAIRTHLKLGDLILYFSYTFPFRSIWYTPYILTFGNIWFLHVPSIFYKSQETKEM